MTEQRARIPKVLIVGISESGKTSFAKQLAAEADLPVFVRDPFPLENVWPNLAYTSEDMEEFKSAILSVNYPRVGVIDEGGDVLGVGQKMNHCVMTKWRHYQILPIVIAQRMNMIAPNVRTSSTDLFLFESALEDCETLARDKNCPELVEAANFDSGDFFHLRKIDGVKTLTKHRAW